MYDLEQVFKFSKSQFPPLPNRENTGLVELLDELKILF